MTQETNVTKVIRVKNAVAAGTSNQTTSAVDTAGFQGCRFIAAFGTITATAVTSDGVVAELYEGRVYPGVAGGRHPVTLRATQVIASSFGTYRPGDEVLAEAAGPVLEAWLAAGIVADEADVETAEHIGLWGVCDDLGYFEYSPPRIGALLYPYVPVRVRERRIQEWLRFLEGASKLRRFEGCEHALVPSLVRHQINGGKKATTVQTEAGMEDVGRMVPEWNDGPGTTSDPSNWDQFVREAHEAEAYSRKLSKRVGEGYAAKRRRLGVPGGNRAPYGMVREGKPSTLRIDEAKADVVRRAYELAATGHTDWEVAAPTGLKKTHVGELLTNPIYAGRLRTGEPAGVAPIVEPSLWSKVQAMRELRRTRTPGRIVKRHYALRLRCSGCHRFLYGDICRYRHPAPTCEGFIAGTPDARRRDRKGDDKRAGGHSYPQTWYEDAIGALLTEVGCLDDLTITEVVGRYHDRPVQIDRASLARISHEREEAGRRLSKTRDVLAWQREMAQLDAEEHAARDPVEAGRLSSAEVVAYLRSLPSLWADSGPDGRQALATALFARTDVTGFEKLEYELTPDAIELGLGAALPAVFEIMPRKIGEFGRGERI